MTYLSSQHMTMEERDTFWWVLGVAILFALIT